MKLSKPQVKSFGAVGGPRRRVMHATRGAPGGGDASGGDMNGVVMPDEAPAAPMAEAAPEKSEKKSDDFKEAENKPMAKTVVDKS